MKLLQFALIGWLSLTVPCTWAASTEQSIRSVLDEQATAWNRGDLESFVSSYAAHCTLVGTTIQETTRDQVLQHYEKKYPSRAAMGKLTFSGLTIHLLDARVATATGHWHLDRDPASGGPVGGVFSLVLEQVDGSWQVELDHTS
jgi:uncharacterized protein (TIGR02246 family)